MNCDSQWDSAERETISRPHFQISGSGARNSVADFKVQRGQNIIFNFVLILNEGDPASAVRIIFDSQNLGWSVNFVSAKINEPVHTLVSAAAMTGRDTPINVSA